MPVKMLSKKARKKAEALLTAHGVDDYTWIDPRRIITAQWVRMKCIALAIDIYATVRRFGYPIAVRRAVTDEQNRYGFLLMH